MPVKSPAKKPARPVRRSPKEVLQFFIVLAESDPPVWRRIQVPAAYTFWDLHVAIQDAMGWLDYHLHEFRVWDPGEGGRVDIGIPDDEGYGPPVCAGWSVPVYPYAVDSELPFTYTYDFGDGWRHFVAWECVTFVETGAAYPRCVGGSGKCPPEDCGGMHSYAELLAAMRDTSHPDREALLEWIGGTFDPDDFDHRTVHFDNPKVRLKRALGQ